MNAPCERTKRTIPQRTIYHTPLGVVWGAWCGAVLQGAFVPDDPFSCSVGSAVADGVR